MFVDDDTFLLDMYAVKFKNQGYDVRTCDNAEAALKVLHDGYIPDAMLVDMIMPGMDGIGFVAALRKENLAGRGRRHHAHQPGPSGRHRQGQKTERRRIYYKGDDHPVGCARGKQKKF